MRSADAVYVAPGVAGCAPEFLDDRVQRRLDGLLRQASLAAKRPENALKAIAEVEKLKRAGTPGFARLPVEKILYYRGTVEFWYRDYPAAIADLERVTAKAADLDPNTGVTAWMRLGQAYDLTGERTRAQRCYRAAVEYTPSSGVAKECQGYLRRPFVRTDE